MNRKKVTVIRKSKSKVFRTKKLVNIETLKNFQAKPII